MILRAFILLFFIFPAVLKAQGFLDRNIAINVKDLPVRNVLDLISENNGVYFTYAGNLKVMEKRVSLNVDNVPLKKLLNDLFYGEDLVFSCYANQIVLKKKPEAERVYKVRGVVVTAGSGQPVEYASIQMRNSKKGTVAGFEGKFELTATASDLTDSISFYRIGYLERTISIKSLVSLEFHKVYLSPVITNLDTVGVSARKARVESEGIKGPAMGALYLDTHGQQVALFIKNNRKKTGRIKTLRFFLSGKGNTEAPFRIRIYGVNDSLNCPGAELLPEMLVVKPLKGRGWCNVDVSQYNIRFPESGIYIAMEGIYPGDYSNFSGSAGTQNGEENSMDDFIGGALDYGQRIGYNRFTKNETWHYSLSHTWFQLDKKLFNVMIQAEIIVYDPSKNKNKKL